MDVQVIAQQWEFTYRYPDYGGVEVPHLVLPADTLIRLHVTSLDAIHSFWAYQLGVKADANPGVDNVVYVETKGPRQFDIHCAELCGLWHGYMFDTGHVVDASTFAAWIKQQRSYFEPVHALPAAVRDQLSTRPGQARRLSERSIVSAVAVEVRPPLWRRLIGFNALTAVVLGIGGYYLGWFIGHHINGASVAYFGDIDQNDVSVFLGYFLGVIGFLIGLGFGVYPWARLRGYPPSLREKEQQGVGRYFGLCTDHKVVGIQYLCGIGLFFFIGGLNAMLIRVELLRPAQQAFPAGPIPDARRDARHDDDGDHVERDPRPVRELLRAADDRRAADGLPADRVAHVLDADGGRRDPDDDDLLRRLPDRLDGL